MGEAGRSGTREHRASQSPMSSAITPVSRPPDPGHARNTRTPQEFLAWINLGDAKPPGGPVISATLQ